jgi:diacylglycerol kinase family enzyme
MAFPPTRPKLFALLLRASPAPVQVAGINDRVFLVNASLGLYPDLLEDREAYKARFGRSRWVAFVAGCATLLRAQRKLARCTSRWVARCATCRP